MALYFYKAFGLYVESEIEIPEFVEAKGEADVYIRFGEVPGQLNTPQFSGVRFQASPGIFLLKVDQVARYLAEDGCSITVQPLEGSSDQDIRIFLLGSVFGALIHMRGWLPLHGSSMCFKDKVIVYSGISGAGKSTLVAAMGKKGFTVLNDDISVVSIGDNNKPLVFPGYPEMKLWADALMKLDMNPNDLKKVRSVLDKCRVNVSRFSAEKSLPLGTVYLLQQKNSDGIEIESLKGIEKFNSLKNNTYRLNFVRGLGNTEAHFRHISVVAGHCLVKKVVRPSKGFHLDQLVDFILEDLQQDYGKSEL